jgi:phage tail-like protein
MLGSGVATGVSTAATLAFARIRLDPHLGCNFFVEIDGLIAGQFREVRGLEGSIKVHELTEGGNIGYTHKLPGEAQYPNLVLSKGITELGSMWEWYAMVSSGYPLRLNLSITILDNARLPVMWWNVTGAIPVKWTGPTFNASSGEVGVESLELAHQGISKPIFSQAVAAVRLGLAIARNF